MIVESEQMSKRHLQVLLCLFELHRSECAHRPEDVASMLAIPVATVIRFLQDLHQIGWLSERGCFTFAGLAIAASLQDRQDDTCQAA